MLLFGTQETITCLQDVRLQGADGEPLCLAHKLSTRFFGAGIYLRDDGYVLKIKASDAYYPLPSGDELAKLQRAELLPSTMPAYSISAFEYVFGYSLWIVLALVAVWTFVERAMRRRRRAADATTPTSLGPPVLKTKGDRFVHDQVAPLLAAGERVQHQAYTLDREPSSGLAAAAAKARFVVLTDRRLIFVDTRVGALSPLLENRGVESIPREQVGGVVDVDPMLGLVLRDGTTRSLFVPRSERHFSNQRAFARDLPRLLGGAASGATVGVGARAPA